MVLSAINSGASLTQILIAFIESLPAAILAISFHESAHGWMANKCGDPTAKLMGRVTMNPVKHFDLIGTLSMLLVGFGWAKPVVINPRNFKNFRRDTALVSLAGPVSNFIMALVFAIVYALAGALLSFIGIDGAAADIADIALKMIENVVLLNVSLMVFNLVPIPPLDGSKVLFSFLPAKSFNFILNYERYGFLILFVILMSGILDVPLGIVNGFVIDLLNVVIHYWTYGIVGLVL